MEKEEYVKRLKDKMLEEVNEVVQARNEKEIREELVDVLEVLIKVACVHDIDFDNLLKETKQKKIEKGGCDKRIYVACVGIEVGHPSLKYYRLKSDQYPEMI